MGISRAAAARRSARSRSTGASPVQRIMPRAGAGGDETFVEVVGQDVDGIVDAVARARRGGG